MVRICYVTNVFRAILARYRGKWRTEEAIEHAKARCAWFRRCNARGDAKSRRDKYKI